MLKLVFLLLLNFGIVIVHAQNTKNLAPDFMAFEPVGNSDMVNLLTGDFTYSLPLIHIPGPQGGYPLSLSYHSGIQAHQEASWVGLGWSLTPGAINRYVSGVPDDRKAQPVVHIQEHEIDTSHTYGGIYFSSEGQPMFNPYQSLRAFNGSISNSGLGISASSKSSNTTGTGGVFNPSFGQDAGISQSISNNGTLTINKNYSSGHSGMSTFLSQYIPQTIKQSESILYKKIDANLTYGALYSKNAYDHNLVQKSVSLPNDPTVYTKSYEQAKYLKMDAGQIPFNEQSFTNRGWNSNQNLIEYVSTDKYEVLSQDFSGYIQPYMGKFGLITRPHLDISSHAKEVYGFYHYPFNLPQDSIFFGSSDPNQGYLNVESAWLDGLYGDPIYKSRHLNFTTGSGAPEPDPNCQYTSLNSSSMGLTLSQRTSKKHARLYGPNFIEYFTNREIADNVIKNGLSLKDRGFIEAQGIISAQRKQSEKFSPDGIGAYAITTPNGRTYHYSIPVYASKQVKHTTTYNTNFNKRQGREIYADPSKYATNWLLTSITGHDYLDVNNNGQPDSGDYGYWVNFEYGCFSDQYIWRSPYIGEEVMGDTKSYAYGAKEVWYLNKIQTSTHTALFVKGPRKDAKSAKKISMQFSDMKHWASKDTLNDGLVIQPYNQLNVLSSNNASDSNYKTVITTQLDSGYKDRLIQRLAPNTNLPFNVDTTNFNSELPISVFLDNSHIKDMQQVMCLKKVYIFKNEDLPTYSLSAGGNYNNTLNQDSSFLHVHTRFWTEHDSSTSYTSSLNTTNSKFYPIAQDGYSAKGMVQNTNNILDEADIESNIAQFNAKALQIIDFGYTYSLGSSLVENGFQGKRLTLSSLSVSGRDSIKIVPNYEFGYVSSVINPNPISTYMSDLLKVYNYFGQFPSRAQLETDSWGYQKNFGNGTNNGSTLGSLNHIVTPTGAEIKVEYESDKYASEYAFNRIFYDVTRMKYNHTTNRLSLQLNKELADNMLVGDTISLDVYMIKEDKSLFHPTTGFIPTNLNTVQTVHDSLQWITFNQTINATVQSIASQTNIITLNIHPSDIAKYSELKTYFFKDNISYWSMKNFPSWRVKMFTNKDQVFSQGGERVKTIEITDGTTSYKSQYSYLNPENNKCSGVTSYTPFTEGRVYIPYQSELPSPEVMYEYVRVKEIGDHGLSEQGTTLYHFNLPHTSVSPGQIPGFLEVTTESVKTSDPSPEITYANDGHTYTSVSLDDEQPEAIEYRSNLSRYNLIKNAFKSLGVLKSRALYNYNNSLINKVTYLYYKPEEIDQITSPYVGKHQISSGTIRIKDQDKYRKAFYTTNTTAHYGNMLKRVDYFNKGLQYSAWYNTYSPVTGNATELIAESSFGDRFKSIYLSGWQAYPQMGPKNKNFTNAHILDTEVENLIFLEDSINNKLISASATIWKKEQKYRDWFTNPSINKTYYKNMVSGPQKPAHPVWRPYEDYTWISKLDDNGLIKDTDSVFSNQDRFKFNTQGGASTSNNSHWIKMSEHTQYDHYNTTPVEYKTIDGLYTSIQTNKNGKVLNSTVNSKRGASLFCDAERFTGDHTDAFMEVQRGSADTTSVTSHTGNKSLKITNGKTAFYVIIPTDTTSNHGIDPNTKYLVNFWTKQPDRLQLIAHYKNLSFLNISSDTLNHSEAQMTEQFGDWFLVQYLLPYNNQHYNFLEVYLYGTGSTTYADDFKIQPINSTMTAYVYDKQDRVQCIFNTDHIATKFKYDNKGQLKSIWTEEIGNTGGFKKQSETNYHYFRNQ